jgi:hypothetical protein
MTERNANLQKEYEDMVALIAKERQEHGIHTYSHPYNHMRMYLKMFTHLYVLCVYVCAHDSYGIDYMIILLLISIIITPRCTAPTPTHQLHCTHH